MVETREEGMEINKYTPEGIEAFLASSFTKGVGKVYAKKIVDNFGVDVLNPHFDFRKGSKRFPGWAIAK